jgi:hypothetical protein
MGIIYLNSPLNKVLGGVANENNFDNPFKHSLENDENKWHNALINIDKKYLL